MNLPLKAFVASAHAYNYWIEVCALVFLICLLVRFIASKKFLSSVNIIFGAAIICGIFDLSLDILSSVCLDHADVVPEILTSFCNGAFYFFHIAFPPLLYAFLIFIAGISSQTRKKLCYFFIPAAIYMLIILTNPLHHLVYEIDYSNIADPESILVHNVLFNLFWVIAGFYMALTLGSAILLRKKIEKQLCIAMIFSICFDAAMLLIQGIFRKYLLTGLAISLSCWVNYEHLATASDMADTSSGVFNYNAFLNYLKSDIHFATKQYMIVLNVGNITEINAKLGILTGNHVYKELGNFFNSITNKKHYVFRLFNSRFVLVFKDRTALKSALDVIETKFDSPWKVQDNYFELNVTGYYINGNIHAKSVSDFFEYLITLDSRIKRNVNQSFIELNQKYIEEISRVKDIEKALKKAVDNDFKGFEMHYQPIYQISTNKFNHSEALIRFKDDEMGSIGPSEFIPIVEACGLAQRIDRYVFNTTCEFLRNNPSIEFVDINISCAEFFKNPSKEFIKIAKQYGVDPRRICIEVTETTTIQYPEIFQEFMNDMIKEGFTFAIDDFGTGYSNFSRVVSSNFGIVKLDKSFLSEDDKMKKILQTVADLLHRLHVPMVIEGVETKEQYEEMKSLGIEYIQGWYFSKALPAEKYLEFVTSKEHKAA